jgi:hypothetical protein
MVRQTSHLGKAVAEHLTILTMLTVPTALTVGLLEEGNGFPQYQFGRLRPVAEIVMRLALGHNSSLSLDRACP